MILDGAPKYVTRQCVSCPYLLDAGQADALAAAITFPEKHRSIALTHPKRYCIWGKAVKTIVDVHRERACGLRSRKAPGAAKWLATVAAAAPENDLQLSFSV